MHKQPQPCEKLEQERQNLHALVARSGEGPLCANPELVSQSQKLDELIAEAHEGEMSAES